MFKMNRLLMLLLAITTTITAQQDNPKDAFLEKWQNSRDYLIGIAEAMPADKYTYKPTEREMDFGSQLLHIRGNIEWLGNTYFTDKEFDRKSLSENVPEGKKAIITTLKESFDRVYAFAKAYPENKLSEEVSFFAGPKSRYQILNLLQDHVTHHRGQLIVYLNLNDVEPPRYVGW